MAEATRERLPASTQLNVKTIREALDMVSGHRADVALGNLTIMDALIRSEYPGELRIAGQAGFEQELVLMVAPHMGELAPAFKRALAMMPEIEQLRIRSRWLVANYRFDTPWAKILRQIWPLLLLSGIAVLAVGASYWRLRRQIRLRREAELKLGHQLAFKDALLDSLPYPVVAKDANQRYIEVNAAFEVLLGISKAEILGHTPAAIGKALPDSTIQAVDETCREAIATMTTHSAQLQLRNTQGELCTMIYWVRPFRDADSAVGGVIATLVDITEIYEAQQRALLFERRLQDVTSSLPAIVYQLRRRRECGAHPEFTYAAGNSEASMGLTPQELLAAPPRAGDVPASRGSRPSSRGNGPFRADPTPPGFGVPPAWQAWDALGQLSRGGAPRARRHAVERRDCRCYRPAQPG